MQTKTILRLAIVRLVVFIGLIGIVTLCLILLNESANQQQIHITGEHL